MRLLVELLLDDLAGELDRQSTDLGPELLDGALALGLHLTLGTLDDRLGLGLRLGNDVTPQRLGRLLGLLDDPVGLALGVGQLLLVLALDPLGLLEAFLGLLELALDRLGTVLEHLVDARERELRHHGVEDEEGDRAPEELGGRGQDRLDPTPTAFGR